MPVSLSASCASFADLPTEILLLILNDLHIHDLFSLSLLSKRLHYVSLPLYLSKCGVGWDSSTQSCADVYLHGNTQTILVALRSALFLKSIKRLEFKLEDFSRERHQFRELERLVSNASLWRIQKVALDLYSGQGCSRSFSEIFRGVTREISRRSCKELTVYGRECMVAGDWQGRKIERLSPFLCKRSQLSVTSRHFLRTVIRARRSSTHGYTPFDLFPIATLKRLHVRSQMIIYDPFRYWIVVSINSSPITVLSFKNIEMSTNAWAKLFRCLAIPTLSSLCISSSTLLITDLTNFISRHPNLIHLNVHDGRLCIQDNLHHLLKTPIPSKLLWYSAVTPGDGDPRPSVMHLSFPLSPPPPHIAFNHGHLTSLLAPPEHVAYLLAMRSKKGASHILPHLTSINIKPFEHFGFESLDCALEMLSQSQLKDVTLTLWIYALTPFEVWLMKLLERDATRDYWSSLHCVKRLHIQGLFQFSNRLESQALIPPWLEKLPSIERVTFSTPCFARMGLDERRMFKAEIMLLCPQMKEISLHRDVI